MCLFIKPDQEENEEDLRRWFKSHHKWFGVHKGFAYVYKVLVKKPNEDFYRSPRFPDYKWDFNNQKVFQVRRSHKPTQEELENRSIEIGLHVYTHLESMKPYLDSNEVVVKFRVRKENIVAIENNYKVKKYNFEEAVCTKLEFVKVIEN
jgi:hypothetical protein